MFIIDIDMHRFQFNTCSIDVSITCQWSALNEALGLLTLLYLVASALR